MTKKIAVTGGIGSGKSVALDCVRALGYPAYSCDEIYKEVLSSTAYIEKIKTLFPTAVTKDGIDRKKLSAIVFHDEEKRKVLNAVAHPMIMEMLSKRMAQETSRLVFAEVPLLFEGNYENLFDEIIVIKRDMKKRKEGVRARDGISEKEILARIHSQFDYDAEYARQRFKKCNAHIIKNDGNVSDLKTDLQRLVFSLLNT